MRNNKIFEYICLSYFGGSTYVLMEVLWRSKSHWSMFILGALSFILLGLINEILPWKTPIEIQALIGSIIITILEFVSGCIFNLWLGLNIWDYSTMPFNLLGQICLPFCLLWILVSIIAIICDDYYRYIMFDEDKPHYRSIVLRKEFK